MPAADAVEFPAPSQSDGPVVAALPRDGVVLGGGGGVALGGSRLFSAAVRSHRLARADSPGGCRSVEIPLVGREVSGVLCRHVPITEHLSPACRVDVRRLDAVSEITKVVVHDINNLLAVIDGGLRLLQRRSDAVGRDAVIEGMQRAVARGAVLTRRLLDVGARAQASEAFAAYRHLASVGAALEHVLPDGVALATEIAPDLWNLDADPEALYFALLNLCRNAGDAMPDGGTVVVSARNVGPLDGAQRGLVEITVADDGVGMQEDVLSRVLDPYFTTKWPGKGTGLGLAQVRELVERQGGAIQIESEPGVGTLVRLVFPRALRRTGRQGPVEIAYTPSTSGDGGAFFLVNTDLGA